MNVVVGLIEIGEVFLEEFIYRKFVVVYGLCLVVDLDMLIICGDWIMLLY